MIMVNRLVKGRWHWLWLLL